MAFPYRAVAYSRLRKDGSKTIRIHSGSLSFERLPEWVLKHCNVYVNGDEVLKTDHSLPAIRVSFLRLLFPSSLMQSWYVHTAKKAKKSHPMISDKTKKTLETMHNCCISINYINETYDGFALGGCYWDS